MIRFISALAIAICIAASAHADVLDLLRAGLAARSRGDFDAAISFYTQAINTDALAPPHLAVVLNSRGVAYDIKGDPDKAIKDFDAAIQLKAEKLVLLSDVDGIYLRADEPETKLSRLTADEAKELIEDGSASGGMIPKLQSVLELLSRGVKSAHIIDGTMRNALLAEVFTDKGTGTMITA